MTKKILFLTGTRADFGKIKSLIRILTDSKPFDVAIFATGMHLDQKYGYTVVEIEKSGFKNIYKFINYDSESSMDLILARTIEGLSNYIKQIPPDLIVVHGDRVEALAGAIVGSLNNILVGHIEGGEVSGTIDEVLRHAISKLSHLHFVANSIARKRLVQMGEHSANVFEIGSPDIDLMQSPTLPQLTEVISYYSIPFDSYGILSFHPVTTEIGRLGEYAQNIVDAVNQLELDIIGILPNNDLGSQIIRETFERGFKDNKHVVFYPSLRFEYFLTLLKNARFIIGNSSSGVREAPYFGIPTVDIGTRQRNRSKAKSIIRCGYQISEIVSGVTQVLRLKHVASTKEFGDGDSDRKFLDVLSSDTVWHTPHQKYFQDIVGKNRS